MTTTPAPAARPPYWRLIAVLASSAPLDSNLAMWLYDSAVALHESDGKSLKLAGDFADGMLRSLERELQLGSFGGPGFEARLELAEGPAMVRFIVTREGLAARDLEAGREAALRGEPAPARQLLN